MHFIKRRRIFAAIILQSLVLLFALVAHGQTQQPEKPLTSPELVHLVYQLPKHPDQRDEVVNEIRKRGIGFPLTDGMRSLVEAKSGSDAVLRRTLEEAERRRANPATAARPTEKEGNEVLTQTSAITLAAANAMPDFIVKQLIKRSFALGTTSNWQPQDTLTVGVSYRQTMGEQYKVLAVNGVPPPEVKEGSQYDRSVPSGATSTGQYVTALASLFKEDSRTTFKMVDTDVLRGQRTVVYEYEVQRQYSSLTLKADTNLEANVGSRGRIWIERERNRVLRFEQIATEIPPDFPIKAASTLVDYDWVKINETPYLLPIHAELLITELVQGRQAVQSRNAILFRGYQKFGAELTIIDDDVEAPETPEPGQPKKPELKKPVPKKPPLQNRER